MKNVTLTSSFRNFTTSKCDVDMMVGVLILLLFYSCSMYEFDNLHKVWNNFSDYGDIKIIPIGPIFVNFQYLSKNFTNTPRIA